MVSPPVYGILLQEPELTKMDQTQKHGCLSPFLRIHIRNVKPFLTVRWLEKQQSSLLSLVIRMRKGRNCGPFRK